MSDKNLLEEIRDSQIRMEGKFDAHETRLSRLEEVWARVEWGILGCVGLAILGLIIKVNA